MTPSSRAEEMAKNLSNKLRETISGTPHEMAMCELDEIIKALEDYAREAVDNAYGPSIIDAVMRGAAEMRERAAKVALNHECERASDYCHISISKEIKSLPLTPAQTKTSRPDDTRGGKDKDAEND